MEITEEHLQRAVRSLESQPLARLLGMRLTDLRMNEAVVVIDMHDDLRQPAGVLHGGVTATLIDTAMAYAVITRLAEGERATTVDLTVHYLRPHVEGRLTCTARVLRAGRRILTVSAEAANEDGALVAAAISTYSKV
jgi:uncharacterized protein (TIGR00369 family)